MCDQPKLKNATKDDLNHENEDEREDVNMVTKEMEKEENSFWTLSNGVRVVLANKF